MREEAKGEKRGDYVGCRLGDDPVFRDHHHREGVDEVYDVLSLSFLGDNDNQDGNKERLTTKQYKTGLTCSCLPCSTLIYNMA